MLGCMILMPLVHLMTLALVLPLAGHMLLFRGRDVLRHRSLLVILAIGGTLAWLPYVNALLVERGEITPASGFNGWWFPLLGARMISGANLSYHFNADWFTAAPQFLQLVLYPLWAISLLSYPLMWLGLAMSAWAALHLITRRTEATPLDHIAAILLAVVLTQTILDGVGHVYAHPHYYNGTWITFPLLAWIGL